MSPDIVASTESEPKPLSEVSRLTGVFFEPGKTFADIAQRPRWLVPLVIGILFSVGYLYAFSTRIGWESYMHRVMDNNPRVQQLPPEQRQRILDTQLKFVPISSMVSVVVGAPVMLLLWAGIALGIVKGLLGAPIRFKQAFAALCYAGLPRILYSVLATIVMFLTKDPENFDVQNGFFSNPGALMDPQNSSKFLYTLASSLDVFTFWVLILAAMGLKAAGGKRLSFGGALFAVALPWAVLVFIRGGLAAAGLMG
ncbi:MAG: hypothetical protein C5B51_24870 [Terriglobia bacterium]|nr:MAG: hypothetical protein C5B51_24870 [Terriglobia bacterium]